MKILIADDHEVFLKGLQLSLSDLDESVNFIEARDYNDIFDKIKKEKSFDLILTDLAMPGIAWDLAIKQIKEVMPDTPIAILSAVYDKETVLKALAIGVSAFIPKTSSNRVIKTAIDLIFAGGVYVPSEIINSDDSSEEFAILKQVNNAESNIPLTPRQMDVLKLIAKGQSNKIIAAELGLTEGTVKLHVTSILKSLKVYNRTGAIIEATKLGLKF